MKKRALVFLFLLLVPVIYFFWHTRNPQLPDFLRLVAKEKYNVVLITMDTTRADRLGCYGFKEIQTPNIDRLAASGTLFLNATAHVPLTLPSHTSIHTGHFPSYHGVHDNGGFYVPKSQTTLAEIFHKNGFATAAFVSAYVLDSIWGLDQGFDTYYDNFELSKGQRFRFASVQRKGGETVEKSIEWLKQNKDKRFFLWAHFYDPHTPYEAPPEWTQKYPDRPYIAEIAYTDSVVGTLLNYLDQNHLREKTVILLTGDHGEALGEHGESTHAIFIYDSTLHVPMILSVPRRETRGKIVPQQARSIDIAPTLLQLAGVPVPDDMQGRSLLFSIWNQPSATMSYAEAYYAQYHFGWSRLLSLRTPDYKYIDSTKPELYDLKKDPNETTNLYQSQTETAKKMKSELMKIASEQQQDATMHPGAVDAEVHEKLAALGYVGAFFKTASEDRTDLPDPKDKIWLFNLIEDAQEASLDEKSDETIAKCKKVLALDPGIIDMQFLLANEYYRSKQYPLALEAFKKTLELKPDYDPAIVNLANTYRRMGKNEEALLGFQQFLQKKPDNAQILYLIGQLYLSMDQPDNAMKSFEKAQAVEPNAGWIYNGIGLVYYKKKDYRTAEQYFRKALALNADTATAHFNLAQLYEKQDQMERALDEYRAELVVAPKNVKAHFNLGRLYIKQDRIDDGIQQLQAAIEAEPDFAIGYLFLAQAMLEKGELAQAKELAEKGLALKPGAEYTPLGHFVLADIYNRQGRYDLEKEELRKAQGI